MELFIREPRYYECPRELTPRYKEFLLKTWLYRRKNSEFLAFLTYNEVRLYGNSTPKNQSPSNITNSLVP